MSGKNDKSQKPKKSKRKKVNYYNTTKKNRILITNSRELLKCITMNYIFIIVILLCIYALNYYDTQKYDYVTSLFSFSLAMLMGWTIHYISHAFDFDELYDKCNFQPFKYIKSNPKLDKYLRLFILYTFDFHDKIHHDSKINKSTLNVIIEAVQNILTQGGLLIIIAIFTKINLDKTAIMLWGLMYSTVHNINYRLECNSQHENHHIDPKTNYALDVFDIIFDTKYDLNNIENLNFNWGINTTIITFCMIYFNLYI